MFKSNYIPLVFRFMDNTVVAIKRGFLFDYKIALNK